jgi:hypothetical protein
VNEFVEQCRREWKRLHVPDPVANEMAAELEADLEEAQAEGVSPGDLLGGGATDARSFAAAWAAERGVASPRERVGNRALLLAALVIFAAIAITGAVLVTVASPSTSRAQVAVRPMPDLAARRVLEPAPPAGVWVESNGIVTVVTPSGVVLRRDSGDSGDTRTIGLVLLIVGLAGIVPLAAFVLSRSSRAGTRFA